MSRRLLVTLKNVVFSVYVYQKGISIFIEVSRERERERQRTNCPWVFVRVGSFQGHFSPNIREQQQSAPSQAGEGGRVESIMPGHPRTRTPRPERSGSLRRRFFTGWSCRNAEGGSMKIGEGFSLAVLHSDSLSFFFLIYDALARFEQDSFLEGASPVSVSSSRRRKRVTRRSVESVVSAARSSTRARFVASESAGRASCRAGDGAAVDFAPESSTNEK